MDDTIGARHLNGRTVVVRYLTNTHAHVDVGGERVTLPFAQWERLPLLQDTQVDRVVAPPAAGLELRVPERVIGG